MSDLSFEDRQILIVSALHQAQADIPIVQRLSKAHRSSYAAMEDIWRVVRGPLTEAGLFIRFAQFETGNASLEVRCEIYHREGGMLSSSVFVPTDSDLAGNATQKAGSAISYARRYAIANALGLVFSDDPDDDDGYAAGTEPLNEEELKTVQSLLKRSKANQKQFLAWASEGAGREVSAVEDVPAKLFIPAKRLLEAKLKKATTK